MIDTKTVHLIIRVSPKFKRIVDRAAKRTGLSTSEWARFVLLRAATEGAFAPKVKASPATRAPRKRRTTRKGGAK